MSTADIDWAAWRAAVAAWDEACRPKCPALPPAPYVDPERPLVRRSWLQRVLGR